MQLERFAARKSVHITCFGVLWSAVGAFGCFWVLWDAFGVLRSALGCYGVFWGALDAFECF